MIFLGFFIQKTENPLCPGKSHNNVIDLLGNLGNRVGKAFA